MAFEPLWKLTPAYQKQLATFARHDRVKAPWIACIVFHRNSLVQRFPNQADFIPPAFTIGGVIPSWLECILPREYVNRPIGVIAIRSDLQQSFTAAERKFIVAHEYSHILNNHWPMAQLGPIMRDIAEGFIEGMEDLKQRAALLAILQWVRGLLGAAFTRQSEIDADAHALRLVSGNPVAERTIRKLASKFADEGLDAPTHYALVNGAYVGVLTYRDRLDHLQSQLTD